MNTESLTFVCVVSPIAQQRTLPLASQLPQIRTGLAQPDTYHRQLPAKAKVTNNRVIATFPAFSSSFRKISLSLTDYEKSRNEKSRNPFKYGVIVDADYFTDRVDEMKYISQFIQSANHLILIGPRRFGKSSVVAKAIKQSGRKSITVNLQQITSVADLSAKLLREFFKVHPIEGICHLISHFRIIPTISVNQLTGSIDVSFQPGADIRAQSEKPVENILIFAKECVPLHP